MTSPQGVDQDGGKLDDLVGKVRLVDLLACRLVVDDNQVVEASRRQYAEHERVVHTYEHEKVIDFVPERLVVLYRKIRNCLCHLCGGVHRPADFKMATL